VNSGLLSGWVIGDSRSAPVGPGTFRVHVRASSVNFPDTLTIEGKYQFKPLLPVPSGFEAAGDAIKVRENVTRFRVATGSWDSHRRATGQSPTRQSPK
jgi:NADPH:quinone reductase